MHAPSLPRVVALVLATLALAGTPALAAAADGSYPVDVTATYEGNTIPLTKVPELHCHDLRFPVISCFRTEAERDADIAAGNASDRADSSSEALTSLFYVTLYEHESYGGASYTASQSIANLGLVNWNDRVSSFKSLGGQHPRFWRDANYTGTPWQWPAGAWVSNVGWDANDQFSSLKNVP